ncbi:hypothetical protein TNCV_600561 [Trichonephila clavipes]|nr:hypothetical protein TNCV_600561 [Trichonephila clavipes]
MIFFWLNGERDEVLIVTEALDRVQLAHVLRRHCEYQTLFMKNLMPSTVTIACYNLYMLKPLLAISSSNKSSHSLMNISCLVFSEDTLFLPGISPKPLT